MKLVSRIIEHIVRRTFREVKYFSTDGCTMPNGVGFQRGNFIKSCADNACNFTLSPTSNDANPCVGVIVFPSHTPPIDRDVLNRHLATLAPAPPTCILGNAFQSRYIAPNGTLYDSSSPTIELHAASTSTLLRLAKSLSQTSLLVKDFANNKIYISK